MFEKRREEKRRERELGMGNELRCQLTPLVIVKTPHLVGPPFDWLAGAASVPPTV